MKINAVYMHKMVHYLLLAVLLFLWQQCFTLNLKFATKVKTISKSKSTVLGSFYKQYKLQ